MGIFTKVEKGHDLVIAIQGLGGTGLLEVQGITLPKKMLEAIEHSEGGRKSFTAGNESVEDLTMKFIKPLGGLALPFFQDKYAANQVGLPTSQFSVNVISLATNITFIYGRCKVFEFNPFADEVSRDSSENVMAEVLLKPETLTSVNEALFTFPV